MLSFPTLFGNSIGLKTNINPPRFDFSMPIFGEGYIQFLSLNFISYNQIDEVSTKHTILTPKGSTSIRDGSQISPTGSHYYVSSEPGFRYIFEYEFFAVTTLESNNINDYGKAVGSTIPMGEYEFLIAIDSYRNYFTTYDHPNDARIDNYYLRLYPYGPKGCIYDNTVEVGTGGYIDVIPIEVNVTKISDKHYWSYLPGNYLYSNYVIQAKFESIMLYNTRFIESIDSIRFIPSST